MTAADVFPNACGAAGDTLEPPTTPAAAAEQGNIPESSTTQPTAAQEPESFDGTQIPPQLKNVSQWLCWKQSDRDGKQTKAPINPETYENTSAPEAAWSYEVCQNAMPAGVGLGFSLRNGIVGIDFDHVLDDEGQLKPESAYLESIIDKIASYTEKSPSRTGLHILFWCDDIPQECRVGRKRKNIEMYCEGRFFTVTGVTWKYPNELRNLSAEEYRDIYSQLFGDFALMCKLAEAADCNKEQMIRMFRQSKLSNRQKVVERPDYLEITADNAIREVLQSQRTSEEEAELNDEDICGPEQDDGLDLDAMFGTPTAVTPHAYSIIKQNTDHRTCDE